MSPSRLNEEPGEDQSQVEIDLPILQTKPSYQKLLIALKSLERPPTSWNGSPAQASTIKDKVVSHYLLSIISNDLTWLDNSGVGSTVVADQREELWEVASRRLAERCGRSAMGEMIRTWVVPSSTNFPELKFEIREPPLTGDNLGLKTWGTAFAIVKKLEDIGNKYLNHLQFFQSSENNDSRAATTASERSTVRVLELGSGTGLVGIAAGALWRANVTLSDLPEIEENLLFNINQNNDTVASMGGRIQGEVLDWKNPHGLDHYVSTEFEIVIAADPLYDDEHPDLVARNIKRYLKHHESSRGLVAIPMRDDHTRSMAQNFKKLMQECGLDLIQHGEEICRDDWAENDGEEVVKCWWGIWKPTCGSSKDDFNFRSL
ncbi:elongation factor methyltransferase 2 [Hyphodiscus hymeniophilus]|uniref:Elongation factor methyltransferase 2 n=1 Tax=Hyphodiscus hymeniophilus TaxID=353542 RepID=A0A9P6VR02_9HELO|nr:elongation factor methyltransferase 2 [Hyphodiscus hymeniophilus]